MAPRTPNRLKQEQYIAAYIACGGVKLRAAKKVGAAYSNVKLWFEQDEWFKQRIEEAESEWLDGIRAALMKRAIEKSDTAAFFFLKAKYPEIYDDDVRKAKWLAERGIQNPDIQIPVRAILVRDELPERLVNGEDKHVEK